MTQNDETLPTHAELAMLAEEIVVHTAGNQSELWARMLYRIGMSAPPDWAIRCVWVATDISLRSPVVIDHARLSRPVTHEEAYALGITGTRMRIESLLLLAHILFHLERVMGPDHVAIQAVRWERTGGQHRIQAILASTEDDTWSC